ncbi:hypothetical protein PHMEG_00017379 [Phytophthora megakarya]|uniref:PiggyBac transposable element-derived protein domain-containing protein n=1 Tax=Phytophthora megakarya TaxID=4795 RepID=A0A225VWZ2_9STRA|nr:hypothetical protein PHMEG_00017379 [Phytophthora megakarya]
MASDKASLKRMQTEGWKTDPATFPTAQGFPGLHNEEGRPTTAALTRAESPLEMFLFLTASGNMAWCGTGDEPLLRARTAGENGFQVSITEGVECNDNGTNFVKREACTFKNWSSRDFELYRLAAGAYNVPSYSTRLRSSGYYFGWGNSSGNREKFERIMWNLHFPDNRSASAQTDKALKVRPIAEDVSQRLHHTTGYLLRRGYGAFTKQVQPGAPVHEGQAASMRNEALHDMLCAVCILPEVFPRLRCADVFFKSQVAHAACDASIIVGYGAFTDITYMSVLPILDCVVEKAVEPRLKTRTLEMITPVLLQLQQNWNDVLPRKKKGLYYAVVTDRFYTSIQIILQFLEQAVYSVGSIQTKKTGFPTFLLQKKSKCPKHIPHDRTQLAVSMSVPQLSTMVWSDNPIVYMMGCGTSTSMLACGEKVTIPCPSAMKAYHQYVGGVDVHDQLRFQPILYNYRCVPANTTRVLLWD